MRISDAEVKELHLKVWPFKRRGNFAFFVYNLSSSFFVFWPASPLKISPKTSHAYSLAECIVLSSSHGS